LSGLDGEAACQYNLLRVVVSHPSAGKKAEGWGTEIHGVNRLAYSGPKSMQSVWEQGLLRVVVSHTSAGKTAEGWGTEIHGVNRLAVCGWNQCGKPGCGEGV